MSNTGNSNLLSGVSSLSINTSSSDSKSCTDRNERENSISSDLSIFNDNCGYNFADFTKTQLITVLSFINAITRETLPVKCILLTLKTVLKAVKCELVEICQIDDSNLIVNYMFKEGMLHKKEIVYEQKGLYHMALTSGMVVKVDDLNADERYDPEHDRHTDLVPDNLLLIPLFNVQQNIWGLLSISNLNTTDGPGTPDSDLKEDRPCELNHETTEDESNAEELLPKHENDDESLRFLYYLSFVAGTIISNVIEKIELEISKLKSNSLITLMHSLFSDQLGIQSCVIALTTHAKKLIQAESCAVYLVDQPRNQLWSISSNTGEQSVYSLENEDNILSKCVNSSKIIIYDNNIVNNKEGNNLYNKNNIIIINNDKNGNSANGTEPSLNLETEKDLLDKLKVIRNGIWVPIKHENRVLAVIEVINKQAQELLHFTEDDLNLLELFAVIVGPQFERSEFASAGFVKKTTEAGLAFENVDKYLNNSSVKNFIEQSIIEEEDSIIE